MAEGDVHVDEDIILADGTRIRLFAVESTDYPGGYNYRFQYYDPETGDEFLRYDSSQIPLHDAGHHHRHEWTNGEEDVNGIKFEDLNAHLANFREEVTDYER
ncbi:toxin-antitoxin system TumE family protein [Halarchaeum nitratireducens]|uniref:Uncharacterized protein n=1 Tax=Halarchaeum nitratireducens TaxID=489913 RepID=A0A830GD78_9EURY|nr:MULTISPECIES: DUF6516 family protein [Halarchaeum]MBP2252634.1 hypothetical protein [Halarchaeum solikamskense]GGN23624.1 hypothetical protein GCM10009021_26580 [Halarchaeum nitratireducens]